MALAKDQILHDSMGGKVQSSVFSDNSAMDITSLRANNGVSNEYLKSVLEDEDGSQSTNGYSNESAITHSPPPLCGNNGYAYKCTNYQIEEDESLINFKAGFSNLIMQCGSESLLSFQHNMKDHSTNIQKEYCVWENNDNYWNQISPRSTSEMHLVQDFSSFHQNATTSSYNNSTTVMNNAKEKQHGESSYGGWLYSEQIVPATDHSIKESSSGTQESIMKKRHSMVDQKIKAAKKQCSTESKTPKPKSGTCKDPQSVAAKNRRERISERLKILQELVPNGSKVDLVTMLEKAISYVKFLQLQVKVLATDEFWPVQGGKAPDISQVKEAIDVILSTQRDRTSSSK